MAGIQKNFDHTNHSPLKNLSIHVIVFLSGKGMFFRQTFSVSPAIL
ncbi:hypothetical protein B4135_2881 [Caldibacillus debilis]|uniref:Uncharacterized protein n=1 Tax=Caldibacillus debilis TaxID=301148 RepID=A0A150LQB7_9BACI|nr:hypothetical protein B4135_2881 [Caldibacillus debilis]